MSTVFTPLPPSPLCPGTHHRITRPWPDKVNLKLEERRARQLPLPDTVSPLKRQALFNASSTVAQVILNNQYQRKAHKYDKKTGQLRQKYVTGIILYRSPKVKAYSKRALIPKAINTRKSRRCDSLPAAQGQSQPGFIQFGDRSPTKVNFGSHVTMTLRQRAPSGPRILPRVH